ncbi:MAG TPA: hypothetical protein VN442_14260 [Bryobacteraceae bacterium]|nr:hypothetical protein [Bryobacteraceae bacterium]
MPDCPYCDGTGWRYVRRGAYTAVEPCDHQAPQQPEVDRRTKATGDKS